MNLKTELIRVLDDRPLVAADISYEEYDKPMQEFQLKVGGDSIRFLNSLDFEAEEESGLGGCFWLEDSWIAIEHGWDGYNDCAEVSLRERRTPTIPDFLK